MEFGGSVPSTSHGAGSSAWRYIQALYARPGVEQACLSLQQQFGIDVVLLLWCAWAGQQCAVALDPDLVSRAAHVSTNWHMEVVRPLRQLRQRLKGGPRPAPSAATESLREQLKAAELNAERLGLEALCAAVVLTERAGGSPELALANMRLLSQLPPAADSAALAIIAAAANL
jgi:uncharacterized protein (TIGR02444 family)